MGDGGTVGGNEKHGFSFCSSQTQVVAWRLHRTGDSLGRKSLGKHFNNQFFANGFKASPK